MQLYSSWSSKCFEIQRKMVTFNWCRAVQMRMNVARLPSPPVSRCAYRHVRMLHMH
jgi:hypothetical protein